MASKNNNSTRRRTQLELLRSTPSALFLAANMLHADEHEDQKGRYGKRDRAANRADERRAMHGQYE